MNGKTSSGPRRLCSAVVCVTLAALAGPVLAGYGFTLVPRSDTVQHVGQNGTAVFLFTLANTGTSPDVFRFDCRVVSGPTAWAVACCDRGQCHQPGDAIYDTLAAGASDTTPDITVYTDTTHGEEIVSLQARSMGDSSLAESIATHAIVSSGIEERAHEDAPEAGVKVMPTLVNRQTGTSIAFATRVQTLFRVTLHDASGRLVQTVAAGIATAGPHRVDWLPERGLPRGVYLLHVSVGDESAVTKVIVE